MLLNQSKTEQLAENLVEAEMSGRSLWNDAANRFIHNKAAMVSLVILGLIVAFTIIGPYLATWNHEDIDWNVLGDIKTQGAPSFESGHYFGTDELGRDLFSRVIQGTQISLMVGVIGSLIAVLIGTLYGATAGYVGGKVDGFMMRFVDIMMSIPYMFILILLLVIFGRSIILIFVGIGAISWLDMSRIVRGQTLSLKNKEYIEAAIATGVSSWRIILRHIVPNVLGIVIVYATLLVPNMILTESFISFLGLGVQEPDTSWGVLISEGAGTMSYGTIWQLAFPLAFFIVTLLCFFFIGDGLRDALDPKDR
ncbi:ABC transporter permease subunit [Gynuella sunshinyii]|uniref:Oligopeptide transport system permease protein OppC n=1 Tax=Gynuella sunshinyii YC6258 TaxID=1445510 RepID=A0A0C5V251_9GAMM|nr:ABC transporter permease subunit [Gynuella sunshinyii]AJQ93610.1 ABC-type dipeptide/oligopeptide/nickel transport system, permease component [Gynuella sunshinyii YC6258]